MAIFKLRGRVTEEGKLLIDLPPHLPTGEVNVIIESATEELPWTAEEIADFLSFEGKTGAEIAEYLQAIDRTGWEDIEDSTLWLAEQRQHREQERRNQW